MSAENREAFAQLGVEGKLPAQNVELRFIPVHDLLRRRATTFFCSPVFCVGDAPIIYGYRAFQGVGVREWPYIDRAILAHAVKFARRLASAGTVAAIGTSVNFETLAWAKGRALYERALCAAGVGEIPSFFLRIENVPEGIASSRLAEIVSTIQDYIKRILIQLPDTGAPIHHNGYLGAAGLVLSLPPRHTPAVIANAAKWLLQECETQTAHSCMDFIDNDETLEAVRNAGIRFGAGNVFGGRKFHGDADPTDIEMFMTEVARSAGGGANRFRAREYVQRRAFRR